MAQITVLFVDDEAMTRQLAEVGLARYGLEVLTAQNGIAALNLLEKAPLMGIQVDFVVIDLMMPNMNGFELMRRIKDNPNWDMPFAAISQALTTDQRDRCLNEYGAVAAWLHPKTMLEIANFIKQYLGDQS